MDPMRVLLAAAVAASLVTGSSSPSLNVRHSPDGRWLLYQTNPGGAGSVGADGMPLWARPVTGSKSLLVEPQVLGWPDFVQPCGDGFVVSAGLDRYVSAGKRVDLVRPPSWRPLDLSRQALQLVLGDVLAGRQVGRRNADR